MTVPGYSLGERIGAGGFGEVFRARHDLMGREVAIKILNPQYSADDDAVARFIAEARAVAKVSHPGIVDVFDFGKLADGRHYCVMELLRGKTLRDLLRERRRIEIAEALPILRGVAEAIDAAHGAGIAHRDLKPDNVFVLDDGTVKLIDFGLAKLTHDDGSAPPVTRTGSIFGTPLYMSPEQCRGRGVTTATDAYSFGAMAYHVLVGEPPFSGDALELALHHLNDPPPAPSTRAPVDDRVDRVVLALLAKDPTRRPMPLAKAIAALAGDAPLPPRPPRRRAPWLAAAALVPIAVGAAWLAWPARSHGTCPLASARLDGVWDSPRRDAITKLFAASTRADVVATERAMLAYFDRYATAWSAQWDAACDSSDQKDDPLLYAQRQACLDNALIALRGATNSAMRIDDVVRFSEGFSGNFVLPSLEDCKTVAVLRAQVPPPPADRRERVASLLAEVHDARGQARASLNAMRGGGSKDPVERLDRIAKQLAELGSPMASVPAMWRATYMVRIAEIRSGGVDFPEASKAARAALADAIKRAELDHNDQMLATTIAVEIDFDISVGEPANRIESWIERGTAALDRAGHPTGPATALAMQRAHFEARRGNVERAIELLRSEVAAYEREVNVVDGLDPRSWLPRLLLRAGRDAEAIAEARAIVAIQVAALGEDHLAAIEAREGLVAVLARAGDLAGARAESDRVLAAMNRVAAPLPRQNNALIHALALDVRLGRTDAVNAAYGALAAHRMDAKLVATATGSHGELETFASALDRMPDGPGREDARAYYAFMIGDIDAMRDHAARVPTTIKPGADVDADSRPKISVFGQIVAPYYLAIADAVAGRARAANARLAALPPDHMMGAFVAMAEANWRLASDELDQQKQTFLPAAEDWNTGEVEGWRGIAHFEAGDVAGAIEPLETSLAAFDICCDDFHYVVPRVQFTLARALVQTGGDAARAHLLATQARDGFTRLGKFREHERDETARWLADHGR